MASVTIERTPGYFSVVTLATKLTINDCSHRYVVATSSHFKNIRVAYIAGETNAMKPMGKYHRPHTFLFSPVVDYHVSIFAMGHRHCQRHVEH
jgi:hypothetical protein